MRRASIHEPNADWGARSGRRPLQANKALSQAKAGASEVNTQLDLSHARCVDLRAHAAERGARDVGLNAAEHHRVEQVEHLEPDADPRPRHAEVAPHAEILIPRA